jgi:hypothetical protein
LAFEELSAGTIISFSFSQQMSRVSETVEFLGVPT